MNEVWILILVSALLTYAARIGGHLVLTRLDRIPPRLEAGLNAVPIAMIITIVTPAFVDGGWIERAVLAASALAALYLPMLHSVLLGSLMIILARAAGY